MVTEDLEEAVHLSAALLPVAETRHAVASPQASRAAALGRLASLLAAPTGAAAAAPQLYQSWRAALALLWDRSAAVRGAVIPVLGRLGTVAANPAHPIPGEFRVRLTHFAVLNA